MAVQGVRFASITATEVVEPGCRALVAQVARESCQRVVALGLKEGDRLADVFGSRKGDERGPRSAFRKSAT